MYLRQVPYPPTPSI